MNLVDKYLKLLQPVAKTLTGAVGYLPNGKTLQTGLQSKPVQQFVGSVANQVANTVAKGVPAAVNLTQFGNNLRTPTVGVNIPQVRNAQQYGQDLLNAGKLAASTYGLPKVGIQGVIGSGVIGGGLNKLGGGSFAQGAGQGVAAAPMLSGISSITNPLVNTYAAKLSSKITNPAAKTIAQRVALGALNVPEGMVMNTAVGQQAFNPQQAAIDFATGAVLGNPINRVSKANIAKHRTEVAPGDAQAIKDTIAKIQENFTNADYAVRFKHQDENFLRQMAGDYLDKTWAKKAPLQDIAQELMNRIRVDEGASPVSLPKMGIAGTRETPPWDLTPDVTTSPKTIPGDAASQMRAEAQTLAHNEGGGGTAGIHPEVRDQFANWVNLQKASKVEGTIAGKSFGDLDSKGIEGIFEFQAGDKSGRYNDVKRYFDQKYNELRGSGVSMGYQQDYLPQLWQDDAAAVQKVFGKTLSNSAPFTMDRLFADYKAGIAAGLTPRFQNISQLVGWYESRANKLMADKSFFDYLGKEAFIQPSGKAPHDWVTVDPDRFPKISVSIDGKQYTGTYKAPPELAKMINNYLSPAKFGQLEDFANWVSAVKNRVLSFGIPGTGINAHGFNILARNTLASKNPITGFMKGALYMVAPGQAEKVLDAQLSTAPRAVKYGLTFSTEMPSALTQDVGIRGKLGQTWNNLFEKPLFDKMLPSLKLQYFNDLFNEYKQSMPEEEAGKQAAKIANSIYGGYNWEQLGKSRDMQNLKRALILAPDWATTQFQIGKGLFQGAANPRDPKFKAYRRFATNLVGAYVTANAINKVTSGHWMFENDPGHTFEIEGGYTEDGQKRYVRPFGTAVDFVRIPYDIALSLSKGDPSTTFRAVANRLSIPIGTGVHLLTNTNYRGQAIYGRDKYGNEMTPMQSAGGIAGEISSLMGTPAFAPNFLDVATGRQGPEQGLTQGFELPFRYTGGATSAIAKQVKPLAEGEGQKGRQLYDTYSSLKGESKFSPNQLQYIQETGTQGVKDLLNLRTIKRQSKQADTSAPSQTGDNALGADQVYAADTAPQGGSNKVKEQVARALVKKDGKVRETSDKYFYSLNGEVKSVPKNREVIKPSLTGNEQLDKQTLSDYKSTLSSKANDIVTLYKIGKLSASEAEKQLLALKSQKDALTPAKTKRPKAIKVKIPKAPSIKIRKPGRIKTYKLSPVKLKKVSLKKTKLPTKKLKRS